MKFKYLLPGISLLLLSSSAMAQSSESRLYISGALINMPDFEFIDMVNVTQTNYALGTARSAAMGGAFTSLGGDISSMSINPAGLGMYRGSDVSFSPSLTISSMDNSRVGGGLRSVKNGRTTLGIGSFGAAFNVYESAKTSLTSFTFGVGYNRMADFNYKTSYMIDDPNFSIADFFSHQLNGIELGRIKAPARPWTDSGIDPTRWGAVLAYKSALIDPVANVDSNKEYTVMGITEGATMSHSLVNKTSGYVGEYTVSAGANFGNKLYVGLTIGIQDLLYEQEYTYEENFYNNDDKEDNLHYSRFSPRMALKGTGYNAKIGLIYRPIPELRIGAAFHSPTFYDLEFNYKADMNNLVYKSNQNVESWADETYLLYYFPKFTSPPRFLGGVSYSFSNVVVLAVDYEHVWYNGMRLKGEADDFTKELFKTDITDYLRGTHNVRFGMEVKPVPQFAIRAGYGLYSAALKTEGIDLLGGDAPINEKFSRPVAKRSDNYTFGLGYSDPSGFYIDGAYSLIQTEYTQYDLYTYDYQSGTGTGDVNIHLGDVNSKLSRHAVTLTLGFRF